MYCKNSTKFLRKIRIFGLLIVQKKRGMDIQQILLLVVLEDCKNKANQAYKPDLSIPDPVNIIQKLLMK